VLDAYYGDPLIDCALRYWHSAEWAAIRAWLPPSPGAALDVGAGRGIASLGLAKDGSTVDILEPDGSSMVGAGAIRALARASGLPIQVTPRIRACRTAPYVRPCTYLPRVPPRVEARRQVDRCA
jgi:hypothetical protein